MKTLFKQHTDWSEPDHFPDLSKYDEISIDLETKDPDDTHRLFYVACTRTEKNLYIIEPQTKKAYNL